MFLVRLVDATCAVLVFESITGKCSGKLFAHLECVVVAVHSCTINNTIMSLLVL